MRTVVFTLLVCLLHFHAAAAAEVLVPADAEWRYLDDGSDPGSAWILPGFDDSSWVEGTRLSPGLVTRGRHVTTYFRHSFHWAGVVPPESLQLHVLGKDGVIVYLNGLEVHRAGGSTRSTLPTVPIDPGGLIRGGNVVAFELPRASPGQGGSSFDLQLRAGAEAAEVVFAWAGGITPTSARVNARIDTPADRVRLLVSRNADFSEARYSEERTADPEIDNGVLSFEMPGLDPGSSYHYVVEVEGKPDLTHRGRFTTPTASALTFSIGLSSCATTGSSHPVFDQIRGLDPLFFLHTGDFHYENIGVNDPALFRAAFDAVLASPAQSALYRAAPIVYMWDDHDYGPNNSDHTAPGRESSRQVYQEYVPHYPLEFGEGDVPISQAFSVGRVRFIVPDERSERDPASTPDTPSKTMMGTAQKEWFKQQLLAANGVYPVIVWVNTMPWIGTTGDDGWYLYTHERAELADFIAFNDINGVVMLSGDAHMLAIDDGTNSDYSATGDAAIPVFHAAALDRSGSIKGGPYSHGRFPGGGQFGWMTVEDDGSSPICIDWSGLNHLEGELVHYRFCQEMAPPSDTDADGVHDVEDCSFADANLWAPPRRVEGVSMNIGDTGVVELAWRSQSAAAGPATRYDIVTGSIGELTQNGGFEASSCLVSGVEASTYALEPGDLGSAGSRYYLIRARNDCGSVGYGHLDAADPRFALDAPRPCPYR